MTDCRLALQNAGFAPIPVTGKRALLNGWQTEHATTPAEIASWGTRYPRWTNTGILTRDTPAFDNDITQPDVAEAIDEIAREWFGERGTLITRTGEPPKRAILFRTDTPFCEKENLFRRSRRPYTQNRNAGRRATAFVAFGTDPDTRRPYCWHGGYEPGAVPRCDLPEIDEKEAEEFMNFAADVLAEKFGFQRIEGNNGGANVELEATAMHDGASTNAAQIRIIPSLLRRANTPTTCSAGSSTRPWRRSARDWAGPARRKLRRSPGGSSPPTKIFCWMIMTRRPVSFLRGCRESFTRAGSRRWSRAGARLSASIEAASILIVRIQGRGRASAREYHARHL